ncbi:MAG TPA: hypothetical protein ENI73_07905 [Spirochaetes bacterium]|nr:hypothetical protein [Spirochaetota bacterium]
MNRFFRAILVVTFPITLLNYCASGTNNVKPSDNPKSTLQCFKNLSTKRAEIRGKTTRGGRGIPNSTLTYRISNPKYNITGYSNDSVYGYRITKPIFTGGSFMDGSARQWAFLRKLRDHSGLPVYFERLGSSGYYKDPQGTKSGIVDVYYVKVMGLKKPIILYLSFYGPRNTPIQIPKCFNYYKG